MGAGVVVGEGVRPCPGSPSPPSSSSREAGQPAPGLTSPGTDQVRYRVGTVHPDPNWLSIQQLCRSGNTDPNWLCIRQLCRSGNTDPNWLYIRQLCRSGNTDPNWKKQDKFGSKGTRLKIKKITMIVCIFYKKIGFKEIFSAKTFLFF